jgi:hypothetical protein
MSVYAKVDIQSNQCDFDIDLSSGRFYVEIGFCSGISSSVVFDNLKFGFFLKANDNFVLEKNYPEGSMKYISSDQKYLTSDFVSLSPDDEVYLLVWSENGGIKSEFETTFTVPRPIQPYPSWVWSNDAWAAPIPYPETNDCDGCFYVWDEESQQWATVGAIDEQGDD